ncbi:amidohydrolase [Nocardia sp. NPDC059177]|uniref:amidohydrolase n=1 Tax=Nocardia sp. NPDC059177 TaxID=3346759 RepID=UPI0036A41FC3
MSTSRRRFILGAAAAMAAGSAACGTDRSRASADIVFTGGPVVTVAPGAPEAEALAVTGGRISAVGSAAEVLGLRGSSTRVVDLRGRALLPAFVEAHGHPFSMGTALAPPSIDVRPFTVPTGAGVWQKLADAVATTPKGEPIVLNGIDLLLQTDLRLPTRAQLDRIAPDHPVIVVTNSGHAAYANSSAFALAGITRDTPDPIGAEFVHDADGELTGEVREAAAIIALYSPFAAAAGTGALDNVRWAYTQLAQAGIATASEHAYDAKSQAALFAALAREPDCAVRIRAYEVGSPQLAADPANTAGAPAAADALFAKIGMKLWADGSPWQGNIFTTFPYLTDETTARMGLGPDHHGGMNYTPEQVTELAAAFVDQGWQLSCHVHGDAAVDVVLDAYAATGAPAERRLRLEHVGAMRPDQFARAAAVGASPSLFIEHVYYWGDVLIDELFGPEHGAPWMAAKSALDAGLRISFHNDGTVTPPDPIGNIATAVTRTTRGTGRVLAPEQRIDVDAAIKAQTLDAAWQLHLDTEVGSLEPGKYADLTVLSANPRTTTPDRLRDIEVEATYLMGRQTHGDTTA